MLRHVRRDDWVAVISGDHKGHQGRVLRALPSENKVVVEGCNRRKKHVRPSQRNQQGGVMEKELPIDASKVLPVVDGKPTRVRFEHRADGSKVRVAVRTGEEIGPPLKKPRNEG